MGLPKKSRLRNLSTSKSIENLMIQFLTLPFSELLKSENEHMPRLEDEFLEMTWADRVLRKANLSEIQILKEHLRIH